MALARGGEAVDDPKGWFDSLSDETVAFWDAFSRVDPFGGEWHRHADLMQVVELMMARMINHGLGKENAHLRYEPRGRKDFMPGDYQGDEPKPKTTKKDLNEQLSAMAKAYGGKF